jgi:GntR family transcriptional regulator/MocR family aminotransferase
MARRRRDWADLYFLQVDRERPIPLYRQIYLELRSAILSGTLRPATKLPSTRDLAHQLHLARNSVVLAYEQLLAEGYVTGKIGSGTFVSGDIPEQLERHSPAIDVAPHPPRHWEIPAQVRLFQDLAAPTATSDERPFDMGRCLVDQRTAEVWRKLSKASFGILGATDLGYSDVRGLPELRTSICEYLRVARAVQCDPEQIIITGGTQQAIDIAIRVLLTPGDEVWVEDPSYPMTYDALAAARTIIHPIPVDQHGIDVSEGIRTAPHARAVFVTSSHQFPLGVVLSMARRLELLAWARDAGAWIIEDDYASEFRYGGRPLASLQGLDEDEQVVYVGTLNKVLFPGLRFGYMVVPPLLLQAFINARWLMDRQPPTFSQTLLAEFIRQGYFAAHIRRMRGLYREARDALVSELQRRAPAHLDINVPDHGMHIVVGLRDGLSDVDLGVAARERGIVTRAMSRLYKKAPARSALMLGFTGYPREVVISHAARLAQIIAAEASRGRQEPGPTRHQTST